MCTEKIKGFKKTGYDKIFYSFEDNPEEFEKIMSHCERCKHLDISTEPFYCAKTDEMIDFHFCMKQCPLKKWKVKNI